MRIKVKRALLSVFDKAGIEDLARALHELGVELVSSSNTARAIEAAGIPVTPLSSVIDFPEILDHRVVTLHPRVHGGLLADLGKPEHRADLEQHGITPIELVVSNLYPFRGKPSIDTIDIGGPAMTRAAAKNHEWVTIVTSVEQYEPLLAELRANDGTVGDDTRRAFAVEAFARTAAYDAAIVGWLEGDDDPLPKHVLLPLERTDDELRYGENPHQRAARYREIGAPGFWDTAVKHGNFALSYLNFYDAEAAWRLVHDLGSGPACAIVKHANPCGVGVADSLAEAYRLALDCDDKSAFGGIVAFNHVVDDATVEEMIPAPQADVVIAPGYAPGVVERLLAKRKRTRVLEAQPPERPLRNFRQSSGGFLVQVPDHFAATRDTWRVVTKLQPTDEQWRDLELAWRICAYVKSNAVVLVSGGQAVGIGAGQQSRVDAAEIAARKAAGRAKGGASATDGFYPFPDGVEAAAAAGVAVLAQPGGSTNDDAAIATADELGMAMVLTGERHFNH
ncbi:MAG TPA: bifunctional phosphoribosylaminoimidazolecarboxamide formyltransferase/IMP cyclohydrolase [Acidimicrobiia bacterium]|nr:bifunctional phosphoribosylaminoimidazolecarboxamide formyltransferase/IMP cyclohydrolase [Acidimicrobiia bacterium]